MRLLSMKIELGKWVVRFMYNGEVIETMDAELGNALRLMWRMV